MDIASEFWKKCSTCKKPIAYSSRYYLCSVSTCSGQRTGYVFCTIPCWDAHVPGAKHRDASAMEERSPAKHAHEPQKRIIPSPPSAPMTNHIPLPKDILIVASKLKDYIRIKSEMNTSANVMDILSDIVRRITDQAIEKARREGRKTVLDRDFKN